ncbi:uncharacterized protein LOC125560667 [Nematostella vectensis]|uniref:uncharacterized protein LOC125560667 n=1 Tax=Nematostella vectensis TaxID=45351 RepID=UPI002076EEC2|nr:uncharacterized protein LOC125560667 [Nematostella vectensis]
MKTEVLRAGQRGYYARSSKQVTYSKLLNSFSHSSKMRICAFERCSNSTYKLEKWRNSECSIHKSKQRSCECNPPFVLFSFPSEKIDGNNRREWIKIVNRKDSKTGKIWQPTTDSRICSRHFIGGKPNQAYCVPNTNLAVEIPGGHGANREAEVKEEKKRRAPPRERCDIKVPRKTPSTCTDSQTEQTQSSVLNTDHCYASTSNPAQCECGLKESWTKHTLKLQTQNNKQLAETSLAFLGLLRLIRRWKHTLVYPTGWH